MSVLEIPPDIEPPARKGDWNVTFTGRKFWPADPRVGDVCIEDIAHHLSIENRYGGASELPFSVAQHSVLVSWVCLPEFALLGLLHDATEAYLKDLPRGLKDVLAPLYKPLENAWAALIGLELGLGDALVDLPYNVHACDRIVLATEKRDVMAHVHASVPWPALVKQQIAPLPLKIEPWSAKKAETMFLARYENLTRGAGR